MKLNGLTVGRMENKRESLTSRQQPPQGPVSSKVIAMASRWGSGFLMKATPLDHGWTAGRIWSLKTLVVELSHNNHPSPCPRGWDDDVAESLQNPRR